MFMLHFLTNLFEEKENTSMMIELTRCVEISQVNKLTVVEKGLRLDQLTRKGPDPLYLSSKSVALHCSYN